MTTDETGMSLSVQAALLFPVAIMTLLGTLQWSLVLWADAVAQAAAQDSARAAALWGGTTADGHATGMAATDGGALSNVTVVVERAERWTVATVTGEAVQVLPLVDVSIHQVARVPTQRMG